MFMALTRWHLDYANMGHGKFRIHLAHAFLTLGKVPFAAGHAAAVTAASERHTLKAFANYDSEHHQCGFCPKGIHGYFYCDTCFPDGRATHALCNPSKGRDCYAKHVAGEKPAHGCRIQIAKKGERESPRLAARAQKRSAPASAPAPTARRRM